MPIIDLYYSTSSLLGGIDPWEIWFFGLVGARGVGKTVAIQKLVIDAALYQKYDTVWVRSNPQAMSKALREFPDGVLKEHYHANFKRKGDKIQINGKNRIHFVALSQAHNIKGMNIDWRRVRYIIFDEFNRLSTERRYFDLADAFMSIIESVGRPTNRLLERKRGKDVLPLSIIFMGNDTQDASDLLERFNFIPEVGKYGVYTLPKKMLRIEYVEDTEEWKELREKSPLSVLRKDSDRELGISSDEILKSMKIQTHKLGELKNPRHAYRIWLSVDSVVDVFYHETGIWITNQYKSDQVYRLNTQYRSYVIHPKYLRARRFYDKDLLESIKLYLHTDNVSFNSAISGRNFLNALYGY